MDEGSEGMEEERFFKLLAKRRGKLGALTRKQNEINNLIEAGENKETVIVQVEKFNCILAEFMELQVAVQSLLKDPDEKEADHSDWYEPKLIRFREFLSEITSWMSVSDDEKQEENYEGLGDAVGPDDSVSQIGKRHEQEKEAERLESAADGDDMDDKTAEGIFVAKNVTAKASSKASSKSSKTSSASVACLQAEAERAALKVKAKALEQKHALDMEEAQLKAKKEKLALNAELAAADVKVKILKSAQDLSDTYDSESSTSTDYILPAITPSKPVAKALTKLSSVKRASPHHSAKQIVKAEPQDAQFNNQQIVGSANLKGSALVDVMRKQNEITEMLVRQQQLSLLPVREIPIFDGNPLEYRAFIKTFEQIIESKTDNMQDRLYYLEQFTSGQPKRLVHSCIHMDPQTGYNEAKKQLEWNFGNNVKITSAFIDKALSWPVIKAEDGPALRSYALFLRGCFNTLNEVRYCEDLEIAANMKVIVSKLPFKLRDKWRSVAYNMQEDAQQRPKFKNLLEFIEKQARVLLDPVFGEIQCSADNRRNPQTKPPTAKPNIRLASRGSSFATAVSIGPEQFKSQPKLNAQGRPINASSAAVRKLCAFCGKDHAIDLCDLFKRKSNKEKVEFLKANGMCFGCLGKGHMSSNCQRRLICQFCNANHPTVLHIDRKENEEKSNESKESSLSSALVSMDAGSRTGAGAKDCALAIVPVKVKLKKGSKAVQTYAFLDPGSSATFCTEQLMRELNAPGRKLDILLKTMGQEKTVNSYKISGLEVAALKGDAYLTLPDVYTQSIIPVTKDNVPKLEDLKRWSYLKDVDLTPIDAGVGLLIGVNAPKALEPWRVINSEGSGPYAVKTLLGWVINGPLSLNVDGDVWDTPTVHVNRISIGNLEELIIRQYNQDFVEQQYEKTEMSVKDNQFMDIVSSSATLKNEHYYLKLPFSDAKVSMPNNKCVAQQRAQHLLKRFRKNLLFYKEYKDFMDEVLEKGYSEIVPQNELETELGKVWYLPHHGVYHPRKGKLRVVFDCAATFDGTSLNKELLQGPDLTNTLIGVLIRFRQGPVAFMSDIEGMFHQVRVAKEDVNFLRFLWWPNGNINAELAEYARTHLRSGVLPKLCHICSFEDS